MRYCNNCDKLLKYRTDIIRPRFCGNECAHLFHRKYPLQIFSGQKRKDLDHRTLLCELARYGDIESQEELKENHSILALYNPETKRMVRF